MDDERVFAAVQHAVRRQIFAEIRHPTGKAEADQVLLDHALDPFVGLRVRQVDHRRGEGRDRHEIVVALLVLDAVALFGGDFIKRLFHREEGVAVAEDFYALFAVGSDALVKVGIELFVPFPVPAKLFADGGHAAAFPILDPDARDFHIVFQRGLQLFVHDLGAALHAEDLAVMHPGGQRDLAADKIGQVGQYPFKRVAEAEIKRGVRVDLQAVFRRRGEIEAGDRGRVGMEKILA